jgi:hypothetical protein
VDPLVAETGQPYAFTGDDPVNGTDPSGMLPSVMIQGEGGQSCSAYGCGKSANKNEQRDADAVYSAQNIATEQSELHPNLAPPSVLPIPKGCSITSACGIASQEEIQLAQQYPESANHDYTELCLSLIFTQFCLAIGNAPHLSIGFGIGTPGPSLTEGTVYGTSADKYLCGETDSGEASYGSGAEVGSNPGQKDYGVGIQFGAGVGAFRSFGFGNC